MTRPELQPLTIDNLSDLLEAAVADADPLEVMPPVVGPEGWNETRRRAFRKFHMSRSIDPLSAVEATFIIRLGGAAIGAARLERIGDSAEVGIWIGRTHRGRGLGRFVIADLVELARQSDVKRVIGSTTTDNRHLSDYLKESAPGSQSTATRSMEAWNSPTRAADRRREHAKPNELIEIRPLPQPPAPGMVAAVY